MSAFFLLALGFGLGLVPAWLVRYRRLQAQWAALDADFELCGEKLNEILATENGSPLSRLPTRASSASVPILFSEGSVDRDEAMAIGRCLDHIDDINRGLDAATAAETAGDAEKAGKEHSQLRSIAEQLRDKDLPKAVETIRFKRDQQPWHVM